MRPFFLTIFIFISGFSFSQNIKSISKTVADINHIKNYKVKIVPYSYFMAKNQISDNGIELKGFYKDDKLKKIEHFVGLSAWTIVTQYFFSEKGKLIFVLTKKYQIVDKNGYMKNPKLLSEVRYYYINETLRQVTGISEHADLEDSYLEKSKILEKDLEEYK
jgi:hypothetical protein